VIKKSLYNLNELKKCVEIFKKNLEKVLFRTAKFILCNM